MKLFFPYFGSKMILAERHYGPPQREHVIEPFAGAAAYSTCWGVQHVTLIDIDPIICGVWDYLIHVSPAELLALPSNITHLDQLPAHVPQEARWLIGFWMNHGLAIPAKRRSNFARQARYHAQFWSRTIKQRIANQVEKIRHWEIREGDWSDAPDVEAHWHIDPPYERAGKSYRHHEIDRTALADWSKTRKGIVHVCENVGATWLPFEPLTEVAPQTFRNRRISPEALFEVENQ